MKLIPLSNLFEKGLLLHEPHHGHSPACTLASCSHTVESLCRIGVVAHQTYIVAPRARLGPTAPLALDHVPVPFSVALVRCCHTDEGEVRMRDR